MSRYEIPREHITCSAVSSIAVGWDRPLRTFFIQVFSHKKDRNDEKRLILHEGADFGQGLSLDRIKDLIGPYGTIPDDIEASMKIDQESTISKADGPAQILARRFMKSVESDG